MSGNVKICIPTLDEEESISDVISDIISVGYDNILVIDGGSEDNTKPIAKDQGAEVHDQQYEGGKGAAMREAFDITDEDILVFIDGDSTYNADDISKLVSPIKDGKYGHTIGNRFADMHDTAMKLSHRIGNRAINIIFRILYREKFVDVLSGFRAISRDAYNSMRIESSGFDIETELCAKSAKNDIKTLVVPTSYYERNGESNLRAVSDGILILKRMLYSLIY